MKNFLDIIVTVLAGRAVIETAPSGLESPILPLN